MLKIGITGGIGSGKTTVCKVFETLGIPVFNADNEAKSVMQTDEVLAKGIIETFGSGAYLPDKNLNREYLANIVFKDEQKLVKLNQLVHPAVFRAFDTWLAVQRSVPYVLKEAALLFESGSYKLCYKNILVTAPEDLKIRRVMQRDNKSREDIIDRMNKQFDDAEREKLADFIIVNDEQQLLIPQVLSLHERFLSFG